MNVLVVGCGSIGKRHIGNLQTLGTERIVACDTRPHRLKGVEERFGLSDLYDDYKEALAAHDLDAVIVCTPPSLHIPVALAGAQRGCHLMIEKPLSNSLERVDELIDLCKRKGLVLMVAYNLRFSPLLIKVKELLEAKRIGKVLSVRVEYASYLPDWHPWEDYREFYMAKKALGGGALLDESHAIDFVRWFLGEVKAVSCFNDKISDLEIETDDIAEILLRFESGAIGSLHLDILSRIPRINCELIGEAGTIFWDLHDNEVRIYSATEDKWEIFPFKRQHTDAYVEEARHFLQCIREGRKPLIDGVDGKCTLQIVHAAINSSREGRVVEL